MSVYTAVPTEATNNAWSAAQHNTYIRDNFAALFPYSAIGDIAIASASNALTVVSKPSGSSVLTMNSTGVASWKSYNSITGALHTKGTVDFAPGQTFTGTYADITGATLTLVTSVTCTILVIANVTGYNTLNSGGRALSIRSLVAGVADANPADSFNGSSSAVRQEALPYIYYATGVAAGSNIVKLQCAADTNSNVVSQGRLTAFAYAE